MPRGKHTTAQINDVVKWCQLQVEQFDDYVREYLDDDRDAEIEEPELFERSMLATEVLGILHGKFIVNKQHYLTEVKEPNKN